MDDKELDDMIHRAELKHYLTEDELTLPDEVREELLLQRKLVDQGMLSEMDLVANRQSIQHAARKVAASRNNFISSAWYDSLPRAMQIVVFIFVLFFLSIVLGMCSALFEG